MNVLGDVMVEGINVQITGGQGDGEGSVHGEDGFTSELDPKPSRESVPKRFLLLCGEVG